MLKIEEEVGRKASEDIEIGSGPVHRPWPIQYFQSAISEDQDILQTVLGTS
jgi:hypothetical protein